MVTRCDVGWICWLWKTLQKQVRDLLSCRACCLRRCVIKLYQHSRAEQNRYVMTRLQIPGGLQFASLLTVFPLGMSCSMIRPLQSQKSIIITFPAKRNVWFLGIRMLPLFACLFCPWLEMMYPEFVSSDWMSQKAFWINFETSDAQEIKRCE